MSIPSSMQGQPRLNRLHQLLSSDVFDRSRPDDGACEQAFAEVIRLLDDLLKLAEASGLRIDFVKEVGVHGRVQDITSLVGNIRRSVLPDAGASAPFAANQFNCYYDAGSGYFANGVFFSADYNDEVAFFVGDQRIYLNRHIKRAMQEAEQQLAQHPVPSTNL